VGDEAVGFNLPNEFRGDVDGSDLASLKLNDAQGPVHLALLAGEFGRDDCLLPTLFCIRIC